jgi:hypothetical protein
VIPTLCQTKNHYGIGAFKFHSGETDGLVRRCKLSKEIADSLEVMLENTLTNPYISHMIIFLHIKTMKSDLLCVGLLAGWFSCIC